MASESLAVHTSCARVLLSTSLQYTCEIDRHRQAGSNEPLPGCHANPPMKADC